MRFTSSSRICHRLTLALCLSTSAALAQQAPPLPPAETAAPTASELHARLREMLGRPGGLTSDQAAARAAQTSLDVRVKEADMLAAAADVDRALVAYYPRVTLSARYARLSPIGDQRLGNVVAAPSVGAGPVLREHRCSTCLWSCQ